MSSNLTNIPNIGKVLAEKLEKIGVHTKEQLSAMGSENALIKIATLEGGDVCINMLYALEGAIQGVRWHNLDKETKQAMKEFYGMITKGEF